MLVLVCVSRSLFVLCVCDNCLVLLREMFVNVLMNVCMSMCCARVCVCIYTEHGKCDEGMYQGDDQDE